MTPPQPGVGFVCLPGYEEILGEVALACDLLEVEPQPFWSAVRGDTGETELRFDSTALEKLLEQNLPILVHSVGCPVGSAELETKTQFAPLGDCLETLVPPWWSEHMSFLAAGPGERRQHLGFLLPPVQSAESIDLIVGHIKELQDRFGLPFAFETGANYLRPHAGEIPDGAFWAEIAGRADCGILLDLHNLWTNERNGRQSVKEVLAELPRQQVWEMHVAAGQAYKGYWLDAHCGLPPDELLALARRVIPELPELQAIMLEIIPDYLAQADIAPTDIVACLDTLREIAEDSTGERAVATEQPSPQSRLKRETTVLPGPAEWEEAFAAALAGDEEGAACPALRDDPAIAVYRDLISVMRKGSVARVLPRSLRYVWIVMGEVELERLFREFWTVYAVEPHPLKEAVNLAVFLQDRELAPFLDDLTALELAQARAAARGEVQHVSTACDPNQLLDYVADPASRPLPPKRPCTAEIAPP